jgi:hypothetical protein
MVAGPHALDRFVEDPLATRAHTPSPTANMFFTASSRVLKKIKPSLVYHVGIENWDKITAEYA